MEVELRMDWYSWWEMKQIKFSNLNSVCYCLQLAVKVYVLNSQNWKWSTNPSTEWISQMWYIYTIYNCIYNKIVLSSKNAWNNAICSNLQGPRYYHTKWNKSDKHKYCCSVAKSRPTLWLQQHARLLYPPLSPRVFSN